MKVTIHRGLRQIGGNIVEIKSDNTSLIVDAGKELEEGINPVDFQSIINDRKPDAILISHYHADHLGLLETTVNLPPVFIGRRAYRIYERSLEYTGRSPVFSPAGWLEDRVSFRIGEIQITPYLADHSALDAYSLLLESDGKRIFYTGDFRGNGRKSYERYLKSIPKHVDVVICEGTALSRTETRNMTEKELEDLMTAEVEPCTNQVFILLSAMNMDRIVTAYKAAKRTRRIFLEDVYVSSLTEICRDIHIPNPLSFFDVYAFTFEPLSSDMHSRIKNEYGRKLIGRDTLAKKPFLMCVRSSSYVLRYLRRLNENNPLAGSVLLYSMWDGYKKQHGMQAFLKALEEMGIQCRCMHTSGHADADTIRSLMERLDPAVIIPIHTENEEWFQKEYSGIRSVCTQQICEVQ